MQISNEEMEVLNRASEILSKYARIKAIDRKAFDTFEALVVSAIDSGEGDPGEGWIKIDQIPFSTMALVYLIGYYDNYGDEVFYTDPGLMNVTFNKSTISFYSLDDNIGEVFDKVEDITMSPLVLFKNHDEFQILSQKAESVDAPYMTSMPVVLECRLSKCKKEYPFSHYVVNILGVRASKYALDSNGRLDMIKAWSTMT